MTGKSEIQSLNTTQTERRGLTDLAHACGFEAMAITSPDAIASAPAHLRSFLEQGFHGEMRWLEERTNERSSPKALWADVRSVIVFAQNYGPETSPLPELDRRDRGYISVYARNKDYHDVIKKRLKAFARELINRHGGEVKVFVDTAPVMEKPLATAAGLGWQGKHTNLVSKSFGSWLFLGVIYTTLDLDPDAPETDHCGSCTQCLEICPTDAFPAPYQLDARKCISYLTIELKGMIPKAYRKAMGNRIYGCDDCLAVCPWNKFAKDANEARLQARADLSAPSLLELVRLDDPAFRTHFSGSPIKRIGRDRFVRNVLIAMGNSNDRSLLLEVTNKLDDTAPLVRAAAIWALSELASSTEFRGYRERYEPTELHPLPLAEWASAR
ncbi:MAG: tRNA epoxyqueuosine(34) reductase QueG [Pseudomonadota bacterium]